MKIKIFELPPTVAPYCFYLTSFDPEMVPTNGNPGIGAYRWAFGACNPRWGAHTVDGSLKSGDHQLRLVVYPHYL